ncbi:hypothetical protein FGIG_09512 [Fasciola gigantica]|uniref:UPAR/Ly6 domain-containing protein n=1 Tax=Fasciola gigantica TaxID=46835 RepID=A0A504Z0I6_FASGI|nr:hypothetical protein FGIG_09512 [Fasciola gigantica]
MIILAVLSLLVVSFSTVNSLKCYNCSSCPIPFNASAAGITDNCDICVIKQVYSDKVLKFESRSCGPTCEAVNMVSGGNGTRTDCCYSDLCNGNSNSSIKFVTNSVTLILMLTWVLFKGGS